jgi:predicted MPP superfamily phosphohydrolase
VDSPSLDVLVLSDLHYVHAADHVCPIPRRKSALGVSLVERAYAQLERLGLSVDLAIVLGDVVDNGEAVGADADLTAVADALHAPGLPVLAVPGNHDGDAARYARIYDCPPGLHTVGGYGFLVYHDVVGEDDVTSRAAADVALPRRVASTRPGLPLVALQHNPLHPRIESDYPYVLANADEVLSAYQDAGVILSLSGHYHPGQACHRVGAVPCTTLPALCETPFRYAYVRLWERTVEVREMALGDANDTPETR